MPLGALLGGIGGIMAGNKAANDAMDAGGALVGAARVGFNSRIGAYDTARGLDARTLRAILDQTRQQFSGAMSDQYGAYSDIVRNNAVSMNANRDAFSRGDNLQRAMGARGDQLYTRAGQVGDQLYANALTQGRNAINPLVAMGDQYRNAMMYNDGLGPRPEGYTEFTGTPGYQFRRGEAQSELNDRLAAMGSLNSGAAVRRAMEVADGMASQEHQLHYNRLAAQAGQGSQARYNLANLEGTMAGQRAALAQSTANNRAALGQTVANNRTALSSDYAQQNNLLRGQNNAARSALANNRTALRSGYADSTNRARLGSLQNQMNLANMRGEAGATRAYDAANAYAAARMGASQGQTQALQSGFGIPGGMLSEGLQLYGGFQGLGGASAFKNWFGQPGTQGIY